MVTWCMVIDGAKYVDSKFGMCGTFFRKARQALMGMVKKRKNVKRMSDAFAKRYGDEPRHKKASKNCNYMSYIKQGT